MFVALRRVQQATVGFSSVLIRPNSGVADLAVIETDAAERAEGDAAADAILVGNLDSESLGAVGAPGKIEVQQRAEDHDHPSGAQRSQHVAGGGAEVTGHSED